MINRPTARLGKLGLPFTSLIILGFLTLQTVAAFRILCPPGTLLHLAPLRLLCSPSLYPFLDYPMYSDSFREGHKIEQFLVFGVLEDSTEVSILPVDLGLNFWLFRMGFVSSLLQGNRERMETYIELYHRKHQRQLIALRLENHPLVLSKEGVNQAPPQVLKAIQLEGPKKAK